MGKDVYANGNAIACKAGDGKVIAAFPDVCNSPPSPPAGPIPVPYPNSSFSKDLKEGSTSVKIGGKPAALKSQSYFKSSPLGDEAATRTFGGSLITHTITGKTYFGAWSMDVKFEGKNVCRHIDITTSNHSSQPGSTPPMPELENMSTSSNAEVEDPTKCPCCKGPLHPNQVDENGKPYPKIKEKDFYQKGVDSMQAKLDSIPGDIANKAPYTLNPTTLAKVTEGTTKQLQDAKKAKDVVDKARSISPPCPNLHNPPDEGCGTHFDMSRSLKSLAPASVAEKDKKNYVRANVLGFTDSVKTSCRNVWRDKGHNVPKSSPVNHKTPLSAGGCPTSQDNLIPSGALRPECQEVDAAQTKLQEIGEKSW